MRKIIFISFIFISMFVLSIFTQVPFSYADTQNVVKSVNYIYMDLSAANITITDTTYTGAVFSTVDGVTTTLTVTGEHTDNNEYYIYQSNANNQATTGLVNGSYIIPEYNRVSYNSKTWGEYVTNNTSPNDVASNWEVAAGGVNRTSTSNYINITGGKKYNVTIDNLWSTYITNANSRKTGGLGYVPTAGGVATIKTKGDNRFGNIFYSYSKDDGTSIVFENGENNETLAGTITVVSYAGNENHYLAVIGGNDSGNDNSYGIVINSGIIYAGGQSKKYTGSQQIDNCSAIGGGGNGIGYVKINGGKVTAVVCTTGTAIGGGIGESSSGGAGYVDITGGEVYAYNFGYVTYSGSTAYPVPAAAIGGAGSRSGSGSLGKVNITGGKVYAQAVGGAAIGGGSSTLSAGGSTEIVISGNADVTARSVSGYVNGIYVDAGASIGGGTGKVSGGTATLTISEDAVIKTGSIGGGRKSEDSTVASATVTLNGGKLYGQVVMEGTGSSFTMTDGVIDNSNPNDGYTYYYLYEEGRAVCIKTGDATISGGSIINSTSSTNGGVLYLEDGTVNINGGQIKNCSANNGGVICVTGGSFTMTDGQILDSSATTNGGVLYLEDGTVDINGGLINGCTANYGGAVYVSGGNFNLSGNGEIEDCSAISGGGVYVENGDIKISGNGMIKNCSATTGAGMAITSGNVTMEGGTIELCNATTGAGIYLSGGDFKITGGNLTKNIATQDGGAVYISEGNFELSGTGVVEQCEAITGGGILVSNGDVVVSRNGQIKGCKSTNGGGIAVLSGNIDIDGGNIINNQATISGGGIYAASDNKNLTINVLSGAISGNTTSGNGGAIAVIMGGEFSANVTIGIEECKGLLESHSHPEVKNNTATISGGGVYMSGINVFLTIYCGEINSNIAINDSGSSDLNQTGGTITIEGGKIGEGISISGGTFLDKTGGAEQTVKITFHKNFIGYTDTSIVNITPGVVMVLPSNLFTVEDYVLVGWALVANPTSNDTIYDYDASFTVPGNAENTDLYAIWKYRGSGTIISPTIASGKHYGNVEGNDTTIITSNSAFSAQFEVQGMEPGAYLNRTLVFSNSLTAETKIIMIDFSQINNVKFYYYIIGNQNTVKISLTSFKNIATDLNYVESTTLERINEKFTFIVDFPSTNVSTDSNEMSLYRYATNENEAPIIQKVAYVLSPNREFSLNIDNSSVEMGTAFNVSYQLKNSVGEDYKDNKQLALVISSDVDLPNDSKLITAGVEYQLNSDGEFILPFTVVNQNKSLNIVFVSNMMQENIELKIELWMSATSNADNPFGGELIANSNITILQKQLPSFKITDTDSRVLYKNNLSNEVQLTYEANYNQNYKILLEVQQKINGQYVKVNAIQSINSLTTKSNNVFDITNQTDGVLTIKFLSNLEAGTYRIVVSAVNIADNQTDLSVYYNFVILS